MSSSALVTGGHGFLGRHAALELKKRGHDVTGIGQGSWSEEEYAAWGIDRWVEAEVTTGGLEGLGKKFDVVVHCAGSASVPYSIEHPAEDFRMTVGSTLGVVEYMRIHNSGARLVYPSSAAVYGVKDDGPIREDAFLKPVSPYGYHKLMAEKLCESYSRNFGLRVAIIRFFSLYGRGLKKQLLWDACRKLSRGDREVVFFGDGGETRDWLHVNDAVRLICTVSGIEDPFRVFNGGSGIRVTNREILQLLAAGFGKGQTIGFNGMIRGGDPRFYLADTTGAMEVGWRPTVSLTEGIKDYLEWFKVNASS